MRALRYPFSFDYGQVAEVASPGSWLKQTIIQWILTSRRERVHHPNYGGDAPELVFANEDDQEVNYVLDRIADGLASRFGVEVLGVHADGDAQGSLRITVDYAAGGVPDQVYVDITDVIA